ncbi:cysteine hydrolase family protein [Enterococcus diestrammenae]|uniref:cysteine hydrolase family protein n=1 Tax=Enterococcus diestrammenae TaxID=1155073 RepID=UPI001956F11F
MKLTADALLVIDLQIGVCHSETPIHNLKKIVKETNQRIVDYYKADKMIIFIQHEDKTLIPESNTWELLPELILPTKSHFVRKTHTNSFYHTNLQEILTKNDCYSLEICGAQTEYCIDTTVKFAHGLGYEIWMRRGGTTTYNNDYMTAEATITFYEEIWDQRFLTFIK